MLLTGDDHVVGTFIYIGQYKNNSHMPFEDHY